MEVKFDYLIPSSLHTHLQRIFSTIGLKNYNKSGDKSLIAQRLLSVVIQGEESEKCQNPSQFRASLVQKVEYISKAMGKQLGDFEFENKSDSDISTYLQFLLEDYKNYQLTSRTVFENILSLHRLHSFLMHLKSKCVLSIIWSILQIYFI